MTDDLAEINSLGVTGTPDFFINGHFLSGAQPLEGFARVINAELERLKLPVPPLLSQFPQSKGGLSKSRTEPAELPYGRLTR